ncbi:MAG: hemerythrin family protein [Magnetococcales bacterium]|nr:hemerythrin family protein [Magnetococcales bacterium]
MGTPLWDEKYAIGIASIDTHHQNLAVALDDLAVAAITRGEEEVRRIFAGVACYVEEHFREEELLMARAGYPDLETHQLLHAQFRIRFYKVMADFTAGRVPETVVALRSLLSGWLFQHIFHVDQDYRPWVERLMSTGWSPDAGGE